MFFSLIHGPLCTVNIVPTGNNIVTNDFLLPSKVFDWNVSNINQRVKEHWNEYKVKRGTKRNQFISFSYDWPFDWGLLYAVGKLISLESLKLGEDQCRQCLQY